MKTQTDVATKKATKDQIYTLYALSIKIDDSGITVIIIIINLAEDLVKSKKKKTRNLVSDLLKVNDIKKSLQYILRDSNLKIVIVSNTRKASPKEAVARRCKHRKSNR